MKPSKLIAAAALALLAAARARAEEYDGVHALTHEKNRAEVRSEAAVAAQSGNPFSDSANQGALVYSSTLDRREIHAQGVARAHDRYHNLDRWQFYRDTISQEFYKPKVTFEHQAGL